MNAARILVVDDEPQITRVLRTSLSSQGYDIRVANDGETALEIMKDWTPDLVITDLSMPNMDGLEFAAGCGCEQRFPSSCSPCVERSEPKFKRWMPAPMTT